MPIRDGRCGSFRYSDSDPAGGAAKNRVDHRTLVLEPGRYGVTMVSDDSHDPDEWNAPPPFDPSFLWRDPSRPQRGGRRPVKLFAYDPTPSGKAIVDLTRVGDSESAKRGSPSRSHGRSRLRARRGNEQSDERLRLDCRRHHAPARLADGLRCDRACRRAQKESADGRVVHLDRGSYLVYYVSDGSHSYDEWNAAQPMDPDHWGISLYAANEADRSAVAAY